MKKPIHPLLLLRKRKTLHRCKPNQQKNWQTGYLPLKWKYCDCFYPFLFEVISFMSQILEKPPTKHGAFSMVSPKIVIPKVLLILKHQDLWWFYEMFFAIKMARNIKAPFENRKYPEYCKFIFWLVVERLIWKICASRIGSSPPGKFKNTKKVWNHYCWWKQIRLTTWDV